jgi:hypothetical protein
MTSFGRRVGGGAGVGPDSAAQVRFKHFQVRFEHFQVAVPVVLDRFVGCRSATLRLSRAGFQTGAV